MSTKGEQRGIQERFGMMSAGMPVYVRDLISQIQNEFGKSKVNDALLSYFSAGVKDCIEYTEAVIEAEASGKPHADAIDGVAEVLHDLHEAAAARC